MNLNALVPIFDCTKHLRGPIKKTFKPEEILTQRTADKVDPMFDGEIPEGALVAVHSTVTVYKNTKANNKALSFNLCAVQVLAVPTF